MQWKIEDGAETKVGNWIGAVSAKKGAAPVKTEDAPF
jgi:hypothetical protein